jgi:hypothetical protein
MLSITIVSITIFCVAIKNAALSINATQHKVTQHDNTQHSVLPCSMLLFYGCKLTDFTAVKIGKSVKGRTLIKTTLVLFTLDDSKFIKKSFVNSILAILKVHLSLK